MVLLAFSDTMLPLWGSCSLCYPCSFPLFPDLGDYIILVAGTPGISCREWVNWSEKNTKLKPFKTRGYGQAKDCLMRTQVKVKKGDHGEPGLLPALPHHLVNRQVRIMEIELGSGWESNLGGRVAANLWTFPAQTTHQTLNLFTRPEGCILYPLSIHF